jgi:hypothetical protein
LQLSTDTVRVALDSVFARPEYHWVETPRPLAFLGRWWDLLGHWLERFQSSNPLLFTYFFWGLIAILVLIFVHGGWVMFRTLQAASAGGGHGVAVARTELRDARFYRREAERQARAGRYAEAIQAAFLALVLDLDTRQLVRFHLSKTPNEYLGEAGLDSTQRERLRRLVADLYRYAFAGQDCGPEDYRIWREQAGGEWRAPAH